MVDISVGCVNDNTYGISCVKCGRCGRKFTMNGVDDSNVVPNLNESYKNFLNSESWKNISFRLNQNESTIEMEVTNAKLNSDKEEKTD